ncbi:hypothetical protein CVT25_003412 [Psilocybe cyanescens]|uniref:Uncharacterized protein n=1 Tax=Psilocybe cyanescens TaxID=93625 RepID=A0A409WM86_PSICY|nr:hypothetical protein CVT25_003412 [Psilocybe cyanescens]
MSLFICYLWYSHTDPQETALFEPLVTAKSDIAKDTQLVPIIGTPSILINNASFVPDLSTDEQGLQISFFMVSASNISIHSKGDIKLVSNFDRLKAQSTKTLEALAQNRRRMADRSAAQVRKLRVKRARAALDTRHCPIHL